MFANDMPFRVIVSYRKAGMTPRTHHCDSIDMALKVRDQHKGRVDIQNIRILVVIDEWRAV